MKFKNIYVETQQRIKDSLLSLWATGDATLQKYILEILEEEKLMAEPVFQNTFPWTQDSKTFGELNTLFSNSFIDKLDKIKGDYEFPKNRKPYVHQIKSWETLLKTNQSIAVTTGTGSGKTECFMIPVLQDLYENCKNETGINAIFLYPLNALIGSQKKRIDTWVKALGGLTYAVYNGNTEEEKKSDKRRDSFPELIDRKTIRETPPQILFTNPSMLEYILVRDKDVPILQKSQGKLRWILLDEAHTLTGSNAAEMALLIRRVIDAFGVNADDVKFAITSATVGKGKESEENLRKFMANLCGIDGSRITIITGKRQFNELPSNFKVDRKEILERNRKLIYKRDALKLDDLLDGLINKQSSTIEKLDKVDELAEQIIDNQSILPLRAHLFTRGIGGVYVCSNPECKKHQHFENKSPLGTMTTFAEKICSSCEYPMYEMVACKSCGNELFKADSEKLKEKKYLKFSTDIVQDAFVVENIDDENIDEKRSVIAGKIYFTKKLNTKNYTRDSIEFGLDKEGVVKRNESNFIQANDDCSCPHCNATIDYPLHFRLSSSFINRVLSDVLLENTPEASEITAQTLWNGHKYISFSDSRQGTAKISALINIDNENRWLQSQVFHKLSEVNANTPNISNDDKPEIEKEIEKLKEEISKTSVPFLRDKKQKDLEELEKIIISNTSNVALSWKQLLDFVNSKNEVKSLFKNNNPLETSFGNLEKYTNALFYDNFARRVPRERSLENLGLLSIVFPEIESVQLPKIADAYKLTIADWKSLLKIGIDYIFRYAFNIHVPNNVYNYSTAFLHSVLIYDPETQISNVKTWPVFKKSEKRTNRLSLIICAGLGYTSLSEITNEIEDDINEILTELWKTLRSKVLTQDNSGYKLNLEEKAKFQLAEKVWLCPVKRRLIDVHFKGFSPWITGELTEDNIKYYKIKEINGFSFPKFDKPFNLNEENVVDVESTKKWIVDSSVFWKDKGIWNDIHENILLNRPIFLAGEHSAQQSEKRLKELEAKFESAQVNILNCSTTMEMGVDIGGISTVVMNNVPPGPANYLQRAGRAGRRFENKSLAFTICAPNPMGLNALYNPLWAIEHKIAPPFVAFNSQQIIERHLNAFFLGKFVQEEQILGIRVTDKIQQFFFDEVDSIAFKFRDWLSSEQVYQYKDKVFSIVKKSYLESWSFASILNKVNQNFEKILFKTGSKKSGFENKLEELRTEFTENSPAYKAVYFQLDQFVKLNAISYLAQEGFLPTAGLPTGIVEFEVNAMDEVMNKARKKENPSYFITRALTEYAPGNNIVIDGMNYKSAGIIMQNDRGAQTQKEIIQSCKSCGYQRIVQVSEGEKIDSKCPHCENNSFQGVQFNDTEIRGVFTEMIQPVGFAVDLFSKPDRKISETSSVQYVDPILINAKPWTSNSQSLFEIRESDQNAEILFYNIGKGNGFHVCLHCGRTELTKEKLEDHKRLRGGKTENDSRCSGSDNSSAIRNNVILGGRFRTDYSEIRIKHNGKFSNDESLMYTLGAVITKQLAAYLAVESSELGFGVKSYQDYKTIFIFDTTKGGAGYSTQLYVYAEEIFKAAKIKLECTCELACTKCVIDRDTQWHLNLLDRKKALEWLKSEIFIEVPTQIREVYPDAKVILGGIRQEINKLTYTKNIKEIWLYVDENISNWDLESIQFIRNILTEAKVNFVFTSNPVIQDDNDLVTLIQMKAWSSFYIKPNMEFNNISIVQKNDGTRTTYFSENHIQLKLGEDWGNSKESVIYSTLEKEISFQEYKIPTFKSTSIMKEVYIDGEQILSSSKLADLILENVEDKEQLLSKIKGQNFDVNYTDRYLKTPFGVILMLQFIERLKELTGFKINNFTFNGAEFWNERRPLLLFHEFENSVSRNDYLKLKAYELDVKNEIIVEDKIIPHYRSFEFTNDLVKITIRPDAGIEHGWKMTLNVRVDEDATLDRDFTIIKKNTQPILYTISIT